jgi:hypothetical protein
MEFYRGPSASEAQRRQRRLRAPAARPLPPSSTAGARAMGYVYLEAEIVWAALSLYWAIRFREFRKFMAGAFFVSWGVSSISTS